MRYARCRWDRSRLQGPDTFQKFDGPRRFALEIKMMGWLKNSTRNFFVSVENKLRKMGNTISGSHCPKNTALYRFKKNCLSLVTSANELYYYLPVCNESAIRVERIIKPWQINRATPLTRIKKKKEHRNKRKKKHSRLYSASKKEELVGLFAEPYGIFQTGRVSVEA